MDFYEQGFVLIQLNLSPKGYPSHNTQGDKNLCQSFDMSSTGFLVLRPTEV